MVKGVGGKVVSTAVVTKVSKAAKNAGAKVQKAGTEQKINPLTMPLQGGISSVGKEADYGNYLNLLA